jgi:hypothetical protein
MRFQLGTRAFPTVFPVHALANRNVQIWTALISMLLLKFLLLKSTWAWSLSNLAALLRFNLLTYRDLWAWLNSPFEVPIVIGGAEQMELF